MYFPCVSLNPSKEITAITARSMQGNGFNAPGWSKSHRCHFLSPTMSLGLTHREQKGAAGRQGVPTLLTLVFSGVEVMAKFDSVLTV